MIWRLGSGWGKLSCSDLEVSGIELIPQLGRGNLKVKTILGCITRSLSPDTGEGISHSGPG